MLDFTMFVPTRSSVTRLALLSLLASMLASQTVSAFSLSTWLHDPPYQNGTLLEEIQCYSLPYGGVGFASHIITYYTIVILSLQRHPWAPWRENKHSGLNTFLAFISLIITIIVSVLTIVRCRSRWQFIVIAAWKLDLSVTFGFLCLHAAMILPKRDDNFYRKGAGEVLFWLLLYIPGVAAGMVGLVSLVAQTIATNHNVMIVTAVFGAITLALAAFVGIFFCCAVMGGSDSNGLLKGVAASGLAAVSVALGCFGMLGAFYSDWILAAIAENMAGTPSSDNAGLYWAYFVAKRLPFFSS